MAALANCRGESWQQPLPDSWELNIPQDIARSVLQQQSISKTINTIHALARQQKPDLLSSLPVLGQEVRNLMDDYKCGLKSLAAKLGHDHHQVQQLMEKRDQLAGEAKGVMWLINSICTNAPQGHSDETTISQGHFDVTTISQGHSDVTTIRQGHSDVTTISQGHSNVTTISQGHSDVTTISRGHNDVPTFPVAQQTCSDKSADPTQPKAKATTVPVSSPICIQILKEQKSEIMEIVETIHDNIDQSRADLLVCIPELKRAMCDLMEEHLNDVKMLSTKLGLNQSIIEHFMHHDQLEDKVNGALRHINHMIMDTQEDWTEYRKGPHAPGSKVSDSLGTGPPAVTQPPPDTCGPTVATKHSASSMFQKTVFDNADTTQLPSSPSSIARFPFKPQHAPRPHAPVPHAPRSALQEQAHLEAEADEVFRLIDIFAVEENLIETQDYDATVQAGSVITVPWAVSDTTPHQAITSTPAPQTVSQTVPDTLATPTWSVTAVSRAGSGNPVTQARSADVASTTTFESNTAATLAVTDTAHRDEPEPPTEADIIQDHNSLATVLKGRNDQVQSMAETIVTTAAGNTPNLPKVNEISSGLKDAAYSSPLGPWTGTPMATADVVTNTVSTDSRTEAGNFSPTSGSSQAVNHQATDLHMVTTNQATEVADQSTVIKLCFDYKTGSLNQPAAGKIVGQPGAVYMLIFLFIVVIMASTASTHKSAHILFTAANINQGINCNSQLVSDTAVPQDVKYIQTYYYQTNKAATSSLQHALHNHGTGSKVTANSGNLTCTEVQLTCWAHKYHLCYDHMHRRCWDHMHRHWLETDPQSQPGLTDAVQVQLPDLRTILSNKMHLSNKAKVTPAMEYIPGQQTPPPLAPAMHEVSNTPVDTCKRKQNSPSRRFLSMRTSAHLFILQHGHAAPHHRVQDLNHSQEQHRHHQRCTGTAQVLLTSNDGLVKQHNLHHLSSLHIRDALHPARVVSPTQYGHVHSS